MENRGDLRVEQPERSEIRVEDLHLDRVVASQPEIGPTPPDGGYGWLIVVSAAIYHITVPTLLSLYGLIILKAIREEDHEIEEAIKIWDVNIALVPVIMVVIRLLLESWCRAVVKTFNMPRFMALAGLCLTVAGVLLSSYSTDAYSNDHIVNVFSGIFAGAGCALTGQQTEVIITHFFREKLTMAQRIIRMAPSVGNVLVPIIVGSLCTMYTGDLVVMIYGAIVMQNCIFLASYTRPVYIEKVIRHTYNMLRDAVEDDDEVIFSNQNRHNQGRSNENTNQGETGSNDNAPAQTTQTTASIEAPQDDDQTDVVVFNSKKNAKEILVPEVQYRENRLSNERRFSSDFANMFDRSLSNRFSSDFSVPSNRFSSDLNGSANRFSSDFGSLEISSYNRISGYQELESIDRDGQNPQPLYRETTINAPQTGIVYTAEMTPGTARRTASLKKNFITITSMLLDINFYLYLLLHLCTSFSILILGVFFPTLIWEQNPTMNIWSTACVIAAAHGTALCFIMLCIILPKSINEKNRLCAAFCVAGAIGFYGITISANKSLLVVWCMLASFATAASSILQQPLYNSTLNEFDTTATMTASNTVVALFIMVWALVRNYEFKICFLWASVLQIFTACIFFAFSFRRRR